jgi:hypothetical protein
MKCESNPQFYLPQSEHIQYKIDLDDIRAFANSYSQNSKFMKGFVQIIYVMYISMVILCGLWMGHYDSLHTIFVNSAEFLVFVVAFIFVIKKYAIPKSAMALFKKSFPENDAHGVQMEASVDNNELSFKNSKGETKLNWPAVCEYHETANHSFIYLSPHQALIIPKNKIASGSYETFINIVKNNLSLKQ